VRQSLSVRAYFILALHDIDAVLFQHAPRFACRTEIEIEHRLMILRRLSVRLFPNLPHDIVILFRVVGVVRLVVLVPVVCRAARCVHVRRIEHDREEALVFIRQLPAVDTAAAPLRQAMALQIARVQLVLPQIYSLPEHPSSVSHIRDLRALRHVQFQDVREDRIVRVLAS